MHARYTFLLISVLYYDIRQKKRVGSFAKIIKECKVHYQLSSLSPFIAEVIPHENPKAFILSSLAHRTPRQPPPAQHVPPHSTQRREGTTRPPRLTSCLAPTLSAPCLQVTDMALADVPSLPPSVRPYPCHQPSISLPDTTH